MSPFGTALLLVLTLSAELRPFQVDTWRDPGTDFDALFAFDWQEPPPPGTWARLQRGERTREDDVREAVIEELGALGYVFDREGELEVDFLVFFRLVSAAPPDGVVQRGLAALGRMAGRKSYDNVLYFELRDPETEQPIWRGRAGPILTKKEDLHTRLRRAVEAIFAEFPPEGFVAPAKRETPPGH